MLTLSLLTLLAADAANIASTPTPVATTSATTCAPRTVARRGPWVNNVLTVSPVNSAPLTRAPSTRASAPAKTGKAAVVLVTTSAGRVPARSWAGVCPSVMAPPDPLR